MKLLAVSLTLILISATSSGDNSIPSFLLDLTEQFATESPDTAPHKIWSYQYDDATVYYVEPRYCCDLPGVLYNESGDVICLVGGGIAGSYHDGKCPAFFRIRNDGKLLWEHPKRTQE